MPSTLASRQDPNNSFGDSKFAGGPGVAGVSDSTSSPVPSTVATAQPQQTPFNALGESVV